jgi:hypothetical protein
MVFLPDVLGLSDVPEMTGQAPRMIAIYRVFRGTQDHPQDAPDRLVAEQN